MDLEGVQSDLQALRQLYGILENNTHGLQNRSMEHGFPSPPNQNKITKTGPPLEAKSPSQIDNENVDENQVPHGNTWVIDTIQQSPLSSGHMNRIQNSTGQNMPDHEPDHDTMSPTLKEDLMGRDRFRVREKNDQIEQRRWVSASETTISSSRNSSSWTSQQASAGYTDSDGYSDPSRNSTHHSFGTSTSSENDSSENNVYSNSIASQSFQGDSVMSSESQERSPSNRTSTSHRISPLSWSLSRTDSKRNYRLANRGEKQKQVGRLRGLKDKLAITFHHHHHHHHGKGKSLWKKHARRVLNQKNKHDDYGEEAVEKVKKSVVKKGPDKSQQRHFHTLVEGLLRHIHFSKKLKGSKHKKGPKIGPTREKTARKKIHWWQVLQNREVGKGSEGPHGKIGLGGRKPKLRALPKAG